jgi:hypothetical protein
MTDEAPELHETRQLPSQVQQANGPNPKVLQRHRQLMLDNVSGQPKKNRNNRAYPSLQWPARMHRNPITPIG